MGLDLVHVLSPERHHCEFECIACKRLTSMDSYVSSTCSHPICKSCCSRNKDAPLDRCFSCGESVGKLLDLCTDQPLAFRVLQRVKVACPLRKRHNCSWTGDYKNLQMHVDSHRRNQSKSDSPRKEDTSGDNVASRGQRMNSSDQKEDSNKDPSAKPMIKTDSLDNRGSKHDNQTRDLACRTLEGKIPQSEVGDQELVLANVPNKAHRRWSMDFMKLPLQTTDEPKLVEKRRNSADMASVSSGGNLSGDGEKNGMVTKVKVDASQRPPSVHGPSHEKPTPRGADLNTSKRPEGTIDSNGSKHREKTKPDRRPSLGKGTSDRLLNMGHKRSLLKSGSGSFRTANSENSDSRSPTNDRKTALSATEEGSRAFRNGNYEEAIQFYTDALEAMPEAKIEAVFVSSLYSNRGAARLRVKDFAGCLSDTEEALRLDYNNVKAYLRKAWSQTELGMLDDACTTLAIGLGRIPKSTELESEIIYTKKLVRIMNDVQILESEGNHKQIITATSKLEPANKFVLVARANAFLACNEIDKAIQSAQMVFELDSQNIEALEIRARAQYLHGRLEDAMMDCQTALGINPQRQSTRAIYEKIRKVEELCTEAKRHVQNQSFRQAISQYGMAIHAAEPLDKDTELYRMLYLARADSHLIAGNYLQALANANLVLETSPCCLNAWDTKIQALTARGHFKQLEQELAVIIQPGEWGSNYPRFVEAHDRAVKILERPDFYKVLGVARSASIAEIRNAYKLKAREWHPDRLMSISEAERVKASEKFKLLSEIMDVLSDENSRHQYDKGLK